MLGKISENSRVYKLTMKDSSISYNVLSGMEEGRVRISTLRSRAKAALELRVGFIYLTAQTKNVRLVS